MRLLTHNALRNNSAAAKGRGFPLRIEATQVRVDDGPDMVDERALLFVRRTLAMLDWPALVQAAAEVGIPTLPPALTDELAADDAFVRALYHCLMNVHVVAGQLVCPATGRRFPIENEIPDMILQEDECEAVRF